MKGVIKNIYKGHCGIVWKDTREAFMCGTTPDKENKEAVEFIRKYKTFKEERGNW